MNAILHLLLLILAFLTFKITLRFVNQPLNLFGLQFLILGILLNKYFQNFSSKFINIDLPLVINDLTTPNLQLFIAIVLGFSGFLAGIRLRIKDFLKFNLGKLLLVIWEFLFPLLTFFLSSYFILSRVKLFETSQYEILLISGFVGIISTITSTSVIKFLLERYEIEGKNFNAISSIIPVINFLGIVSFGVILSLTQNMVHKNFQLSSAEIFLISSLTGLILSFIFFFIVERKSNEFQITTILFAFIIFASGLAYYLNFSPIIMNLLFGFVLGNIFFKETIPSIFEKAESVFYPLALIFLGSQIKVVSWSLFISGIIAILILRYIVVYLSGWFAYKMSYDKNSFSFKIGLGFYPQGLIAISLALNFYQLNNSEFNQFILGVFAFVVVLSEVLSTSFTKKFLIESNELRLK